eukprot:TRINITY_DN38606_c0_g2_i1.p1 TRINITY_DN38606_c0_g2~~TRINITY_DN38606_c0_g2_i1.p1  ORF type:complete len:231 (-),score=53.20 TRINITY_DN38606_c0_g2_i1:319-1011(-)
MFPCLLSLLVVLTTIEDVNGIERALLQEFGGFSIDSSISDSLNSFEQDAQEGSAVSQYQDANSGNSLQADMISDIYPDDQVGVGVGQFALDNFAESEQGYGEANSGNQIGVDLGIADTSFAADQIAAQNFAEADTGDANAGNQNQIGDITNSNIDIDSVAIYNTAITDSGTANSGNFGEFEDISGSEFDLDEIAIGNVAQSNSGDANSGNFGSFGNISGRKLQKFEQENH